MKKMLWPIYLAVLVFSVSTSAVTQGVRFYSRVNPSLSYVGKIFEGNTGLTAGAGAIQENVRNFAPGFDFSGDIIHKSGFGGGIKIFYLPTTWSISDLSGSLNGDANFVSLTAGPRYYHAVNEKVEVFGEANIGWYKTDASLRIGTVTVSDSKNSFGFNFGAGVEWNVYKLMTVGGKTLVHYISDTGGNDDAMIFSVGPTIGMKF